VGSRILSPRHCEMVCRVADSTYYCTCFLYQICSVAGWTEVGRCSVQRSVVLTMLPLMVSCYTVTFPSDAVDEPFIKRLQLPTETVQMHLKIYVNSHPIFRVNATNKCYRLAKIQLGSWHVMAHINQSDTEGDLIKKDQTESAMGRVGMTGISWAQYCVRLFLLFG